MDSLLHNLRNLVLLLSQFWRLNNSTTDYDYTNCNYAAIELYLFSGIDLDITIGVPTDSCLTTTYWSSLYPNILNMTSEKYSCSDNNNYIIYTNYSDGHCNDNNILSSKNLYINDKELIEFNCQGTLGDDICNTYVQSHFYGPNDDIIDSINECKTGDTNLADYSTSVNEVINGFCNVYGYLDESMKVNCSNKLVTYYNDTVCNSINYTKTFDQLFEDCSELGTTFAGLTEWYCGANNSMFGNFNDDTSSSSSTTTQSDDIDPNDISGDSQYVYKYSLSFIRNIICIFTIINMFS